MLAVKLGVEKNYEEAKSLVEKTLKVAPDNPHAMRYISKYLRYQVGVADCSYNNSTSALPSQTFECS